MAGFLQGGGVGKSLAEWMIHGEPQADIFGMDVARYGDFASNREYIRQTTGQFYSRRFVMTYPNEQLPAGPAACEMSRRLRRHDRAGARWGVRWGLEVPIYFAPEDFDGDADAETLQRLRHRRRGMPQDARSASACSTSPASPATRCRVRTRERGSTGFWPARLPKPGRARLAPMLGARRPAQGRPHRLQLGRWHLVDHGLVLSPPMAHALVRRACGARRLGPRHFGCDGRLRASPARSPASSCSALTGDDVSEAGLAASWAARSSISA